ncbi:MAG: sigma-70 family RNA polymerase sigma factor [Bacilli bacterium]
MKYSDMNDYELLSYVSENGTANEMIFKKYKPLIVETANNLYVYCKKLGVEINDLIQEGLVGLNKAINSFSESHETTFYTYASKCINRSIISYIVRLGRLKNKVLNDSVFLELYDEDQSNGFGKSLADNSYNPENILISEEGKKEILDIIDNNLTDFEKQVINLKINGFKYKEIADMLGKDVKYIDNCIQKIKNKIRLKLDI